ncbi:MAG: DNA cytosine methyltransferase [Verrucomicrobiota bacterium]
MNELALFAGAGGGILGGELLGWRCICAVERDLYAASILAQRQNDGVLPPFPIWSDVGSFDGRPWRGLVDVVSGGFSCQDISAAGKGAGIGGERSGLWAEMARIVRDVRPRYVFVENSPLLVSRGLGMVLADLAQMGYDARWGIVGAHHVGAPHKRDRIWIVANALRDGAREEFEAFCPYSGPTEVRARGWQGPEPCDSRETLANADKLNDDDGRHDPSAILRERSEASKVSTDSDRERWHGLEQENSPRAEGEGSAGEALQCPFNGGNASWWESEPAVGRVANGVGHRVDRLRALGNGQVPAVAATAWRVLSGEI